MAQHLMLNAYDSAGHYLDTYAVKVRAILVDPRTPSIVFARLDHPDLNGGEPWSQDVVREDIREDDDLATWFEQ